MVMSITWLPVAIVTPPNGSRTASEIAYAPLRCDNVKPGVGNCAVPVARYSSSLPPACLFPSVNRKSPDAVFESSVLRGQKSASAGSPLLGTPTIDPQPTAGLFPARRRAPPLVPSARTRPLALSATRYAPLPCDAIQQGSPSE